MDFNFKDFSNFKFFITPTFIKIIFWIGVVLCVLGGLAMMIGGAGSRYGGGTAVFMGLLYIIIGPIFCRIYCEILIIIFKINESLEDIKKK